MIPEISIIICTHNPQRDYLDKVIQALKSQTLPMEQWELLLIDNASNSLLAKSIDLSWHSQAFQIREDKLGKSYALLNGFREARAELLVTVDDDNVLDSDYLEIALQISRDWPTLGAWGGKIRPNFEETPPDWTKPYWPMLAIREFDRDKWSNLLYQHETTPPGAGMCVRKIVAEKYMDLVRAQPELAGMGPKGKLLTRCEDSDLAFTACNIGLGTGQFTSLKLTHLIPGSRLQENYLLRLVEGISYSGTLLDFFWGKLPPNPPKLSWRRLLQYCRRWRMNPRTRRFCNAQQRGIALALKEINNRLNSQ